MAEKPRQKVVAEATLNHASDFGITPTWYEALRHHVSLDASVALMQTEKGSL